MKYLKQMLCTQLKVINWFKILDYKESSSTMVRNMNLSKVHKNH
jgi:hypothetical protein